MPCFVILLIGTTTWATLHSNGLRRQTGQHMNNFVLLGLCVAAIALESPVKAEQFSASASIPWRQNLTAASAEAATTGKPILAQITATWCGACQQMFRDTYSDGQVAQLIHGHFIPVKIDADEHSDFVSNRSINAFPSTLILNASQTELMRAVGYVSAPELSRRLQPLVTTRHVSQVSVSSSKPHVTRILPTVIRQASHAQLTENANAGAFTSSRFAVPESRLTPMEVAFGGVCLVSTLEKRKPTSGQAQYSVAHRGVRLQFADKDQLVKFQAKPEKYWPWMDGDCPVSVQEKNALGSVTAGNPHLGGVYQDRLIFFRNESHRTLFATSPEAFIPTRAVN